MSTNTKNPHEGEKGRPIDGKEEEFFQWERDQELKRRESLSKDQQEKLKQADDHLAKKMNS